MGRLVRPLIITKNVQAGGEGLESTEGNEPPPAQKTLADQGDTYLDRVAKYVPAEIVAFFIFANSILKQSMHATPPTMAGIEVASIGFVVFLLAWLFTPIYLWRLSRPGDAWGLNATMATLLFPVWAYAVEGVGATKFVPYDGDLASIVLGAASLASGIVAPRTVHVDAKDNDDANGP